MTRKEKLLVGKLIGYIKAYLVGGYTFKEEIEETVKQIENILKK